MPLNKAPSFGTTRPTRAGNCSPRRRPAAQRATLGLGDVPADLDILLAELALGLADALNAAQFLGSSGSRFADSFDTLDHVDTAGAANLDTGTAGLLKPSSSGGSDLATTAQAISGGDSGSGTRPKGNAFDNDNGTRWGSLQTDMAVSGVAYIGQDFGAGNDKHIRTITVRQRQDQVDAQIASVKVQHSDNGSSWTDVGTYTLTEATNPGTDTLELPATAAHRYWRLLANGNPASSGGWEWQVDEIATMEAAVTQNLTVRSTALTAASAPVSMKAVARAKFVDSVTLNADYKISVSRDGGTNWTDATLNDRFTVNSIRVLESDTIDVSSQPSGTAVKWRIETANNKMAETHDIYLYWT